MFLGRVVGNVWASVKWQQLEGLRFLLVRPYHYAELNPDSPVRKRCTDAVVAADVLGACIGEDVIIAYGHAARAGIEELLQQGEMPSHPVDAAIVAIVDKFHVDCITDEERV